MKAAIYDEFHSPIRIDYIPIPQTPPDGVLIQVKATGVCRSDWHGWVGHDDDIRRHGLPFVPGHEFSGIIVDIGSEVVVSSKKKNELCIGSRVVVPFILSCGTCVECTVRNRSTVCTSQQQPGFTMYGSFAEYVAIPRADRNIFVLPDTISFVEAAALGCRFTTAFRAVVQQGLQLSITTTCALTEHRQQTFNASIAIFGCGGLGLSCIMISKAIGVETIVAIDVSETALQKARQCGATHVILAPRDNKDCRAKIQTNLYQQVVSCTGQEGADVCIDAGGFASTCENAVYCARRGGRMVQVGLPNTAPMVPMTRVAGWEVEIVGSHGFDAVNDMTSILDLVSQGKLQPMKLIEREVTLELGVKALMEMDKSSPLGITMITNFRDNSSIKPYPSILAHSSL